MLGLELGADVAIDPTFETFIGWAFLAKGSVDEQFILYEGGVVAFNATTTELSMYQTVTVTPNALRPSMASKETILANTIGAAEKVDVGTAEQTADYWTWDRASDIATPNQIAFALKRNAWSNTVDFYTGGLYRFYLSVS